MKLLNIGFGNMVVLDKLVAIVSPDSAPIKRTILEAREQGNIIDASFGRKTRSVLIMDSGHVILSALQTETLFSRIPGHLSEESVEEGENNPDV